MTTRDVKRKVIVALMVLAMTLGVAGCGSGIPEEATSSAGNGEGWAPSTVVFYETVDDGREVMCIWAWSSRRGEGSLSCDWDNAK